MALMNSNEATKADEIAADAIILVTPVWNDSERLEQFGRRLAETLAAAGLPVRWVIADDGSSSQEAARYETLRVDFSEIYSAVDFMRITPRSRKGGAIYAAWKQYPEADHYAFVDADGAVSPESMVALIRRALRGGHVQRTLDAHPNAPRFQDFRQMFDTMESEIEAVLIATPDHAHFCATMLAMSLGKHVYVEKPLAHTFGQTARLMAMEKKTGLVTQVGNQGHSGANYFQFKAWSEAGVIRDVTKITAHMNRDRRWHGWGPTAEAFPEEPMPDGLDWEQWADSAAVRPFSRKLHPEEWRSWYLYGSGMMGRTISQASTHPQPKGSKQKLSISPVKLSTQRTSCFRAAAIARPYGSFPERR